VPQKKSIKTMRVPFNIYDPEALEEATGYLELARIPAIGECVMTSDNNFWLKVVLVVHTLNPSSNEVVIYTMRIKRSDAIAASGYKGIK
jgi:hypothetical protein